MSKKNPTCRSVYSMASMYTDNVWIQSQDKAIKAGRLLGEVLEKRVQGQRPVILVSSVKQKKARICIRARN